MKASMLSQIHSFIVDQANADESGGFRCPCCGNLISPDDHSENAYSILEVKMNVGYVEEIVIQCNKCGSQVNMTGFSVEFESRGINSDVNYIAHV